MNYEVDMPAVALFSGGKDSLYALYLSKKQGIKIKRLICLIPGLQLPSPHAENINALKLIAKSMNIGLTIVDLHKGVDELIKVLRNLDVRALVAGDVYIEDHKLWLEKICKRTDMNLLEPLFGRNSLKLFKDIFDSGFIASIIGVDTRYIGEEWLGFVLSEKTAHSFLDKNKGIDPLGENGEYHTIVIESPLYPKQFRIKYIEKIVVRNIRYLRVLLF